MNRILVFFMAASALSAVSAADLYAPAGVVTTNFVADGTSVTHEGRLAVASDGLLVKTGGGEWTIPMANIVQGWPFSAFVYDGALTLSSNGVTLANDVPAVLQNDATLWLSMKDADASHFVRNGDSLVRWYDVREADVSNPKRFSVAADFTYASAGTYPQVTTKDGFPCVYFNGVGSGTAMSLRNTTNPDTMTQVNSYHVFAVVGHYTCQGIVFGSGTSVGNMFMASVNANGVASAYADPSRLWPSTTRGVTYVDGERCDVYRDIPPSGRFHLFDSGSPVNGKFGALFGQWGSKIYWGGDYLAEAIVFTREISETERLQVQSYLAKKWFPDTAVVRNVQLNGGAEVRADDLGGLNVSGAGVLVKTGTGTVPYRVADATSANVTLFNGGLEIAAGAVDLSTRLPLKVPDGTEIAAELTDAGNMRVTTAATAAGKIVKSGTGDVAIDGLPSGVTELDVRAGTLEVDRGVTGREPLEESFYVPIENPGFETFATEEEWTSASTPGQIIPTATDVGTYKNGWRRSVNQTWMLNWRVLSDSWKTSYNLTHRPHGGDVVAMIHQNGILATPVTIPKPGMYELTFDVGGRESAAYLGDYVKGSLYNVSSKAAIDFGRGYLYEFGYRRVKLRAVVSVAGAYELRFQDSNIAERPIVVDNVALRYVPVGEDVEMAWPVPNGGFEYDQDLTGSDNRKYVVESPFANWTFEADEPGTVAVVTAAATNGVDGQVGVEYSPSRGAVGGFRQLLMKAAPCSATVTCTPPKGTYYLRADLGRYYNYRGQCMAKVTIGEGEPADLGTFIVSNSVMRTFTWGKPFEVSGADSVSITFAFARNQSANSTNTGIWLDDVRLVAYDACELVENGGFEKSSKEKVNWADGWETVTNQPSAGGLFAQVQPYSYLPNIFSSDPIEGTHFLYLQGIGGAARKVNLPYAGLYRLSFQTAFSRRGAEGDAAYSKVTPVRAWLAQGAVTNEIGRTGDFKGTNFCQHVWSFRVPSAGEYVLGLQGTLDSKNGYNVCVDAVSIRKVDERRYRENVNSPLFGEKTKVSVAAGARLRVDFAGTNKVDELKLGGHKVKGYIDVADYPDYLSGCGCFLVEPKGLLMIVK